MAMLGVDIKNDGIMRSYTGHGMIEKHPAGLTIAGVMGHELGHINGARNLALAGGATVISENIELSVEFEGSRLVATGGKATTVTARPANPAAAYKKAMDGFEAEKAQLANPARPARSAAQLREAGAAADKPAKKEDDKTPDARASELSSMLSQQKQKLESRLQQLSQLDIPAGAEAPGSIAIQAKPGEDGENAPRDPVATAAASADAAARRQAAVRLDRVKEQIAKIDNIMASLSIVKSVKTLDGILQAVAGAGLLAGSADYASSAASSPLIAAPARTERKTAMEAMISMLEDSLRGMVVNLSA